LNDPGYTSDTNSQRSVKGFKFDVKTRSALGCKRIQLRSLCVQRDLLRASSSAGFKEERKIGRDEGSTRKHQISDRRCSALPRSEWVFIDPATETEKEGWPSEDPVPGDHDETCEKHARGREPLEVILRAP